MKIAVLNGRRTPAVLAVGCALAWSAAFACATPLIHHNAGKLLIITLTAAAFLASPAPFDMDAPKSVRIAEGLLAALIAVQVVALLLSKHLGVPLSSARAAATLIVGAGWFTGLLRNAIPLPVPNLSRHVTGPLIASFGAIALILFR
jgi:hypothetical protein